MNTNLYTIEFIQGGTKHTVGIRARNKVEAIAQGFEKLGSWREKDSVDSINIIEDAGNAELTAADYK